MDFTLKTLIEKLNPLCRKSLESAAGLCISQTHFNIELEHFLLKLIEITNSDIYRILKFYNINTDEISKELIHQIDKFKRGNSRTPALSPYITQLIQEAWTLTTLVFNKDSIRSGFIILALLDNTQLKLVLIDSVPLFSKVLKQNIYDEIKSIINSSNETQGQKTIQKNIENKDKLLNHDLNNDFFIITNKFPYLTQFTVDMTAEARLGKIDPITGRDSEIRQIIDILMRRRQNNPILTGEAGVGKTAVVEGLALKIVAGEVPPILKNISLRLLDLGLLQAGAGIKGEFENRLKNVIKEVKESPIPIILFIDEAHTLIGAGGTAGQNDAANLLKPALARGELRTIAATTWSEYKKYFEKDPALSRRFQVVKVEEPNDENAIAMLRALAKTLEKHHKIRILDEAIKDSVKLSHRYIIGRQLPDKAISVLDTASARVAIAQNDIPPIIEDIKHQICLTDAELKTIQREDLSNQIHNEKLILLSEKLDKLNDRLSELNSKWQKELTLVKKIIDYENQLDNISLNNNVFNSNDISIIEELQFNEKIRWEIERLKEELKVVQLHEKMIPICVDSEVIASVISGWTGIPVGKMLSDEIHTILNLKKTMHDRLVGQEAALDAIARRIQTSRADMIDPNKPVGVFLLVGPSGVGKTETALTIADILFGGEKNVITINMSEYQESHSVSTLKGAPPGYVGYGQGGILTEAVRRNPYSVVLLDEVEKAHQDVMELFYQVFDKGILEDGEGSLVDFKNTIILLTSNLGSEKIVRAYYENKIIPSSDELIELITPDLIKHFKSALLGRMVIVPYLPLSNNEIKKIIQLKIKQIQNRFLENHNAILTYQDNLLDFIANNTKHLNTGARAIDNILTNTLLPELSNEILQRMAEGRSFETVNIAINDNGLFEYKFDNQATQTRKKVTFKNYL